jgi:DNA polymerase-3 subunit alpha (Gram-positive type)
MIAFDLETTGFSPRFNEIIEVGACTPHHKFQVYVKSVARIPKKITDITGISMKQLYNAPIPQDAMKQFADITRNTTLLIGYNSHRFDLGFVFEAFQKHSLVIHTTKSVDLITVVKMRYPGLKNYKLQTVYTYIFRKPFPNAHSAVADAQATLDIANEIDIKTLMKYSVNMCDLYWLHRARMDRLNSVTTIKKNDNDMKCLRCQAICSTYFMHYCS